MLYLSKLWGLHFRPHCSFVHYNPSPSFRLLIPDTIGLLQKPSSYTSDQQLVIKLL